MTLRPSREPAFDGAAHVLDAQMELAVVHMRSGQRLLKVAKLADVLKQFADGSDTLACGVVLLDLLIDEIEHAHETLEQEIVLASEVRIEGRPSHIGAIQQILDGDGVVSFLEHQFDERFHERMVGATNSSIVGPLGGVCPLAKPNNWALFVHNWTFPHELVVDRKWRAPQTRDASSPQTARLRKMKRDVVSGTLLMVGALVGVLVMAFHPTGHSLLAPGQFAHEAFVNRLVHGLAIAAIPLVFLGLLGLTRRLESTELSVAALVIYGFGAISVMCAAVASGFVATDVMEKMLESDGATRETYHALLAYTGVLNQAFAKVHVVATSAAFMLWGVAIERSRALGRAVGIAGICIGFAALLAVLSGHLRLDVHGFGMVVLLQAVWLIWIGVLLGRRA